ncbi:Gustatory receptor [Operophtera brumata]|uniref:Gustatory receptor n=1 Tax=Operophtera brumata TaxID=104452 RepID=A0A0L7L6Z6_OPEBR|nr:Gustatory receptor [Operophtera brumata]
MKKYPCEFYSSLRHLMRLCRWTGFFPVEGLNDSKTGRSLLKAAMDTEQELRGIRKTKNIPRVCTVLSYTVMILALDCHMLLTTSLTISGLDSSQRQFLCMQATFMWSFTDVMVMCVSVYLTSYFQDLGKAINSKEPRNWGQLRLYYSRLVSLVNQINSQLGGLILLTAFSDLCFICVQLFYSLHNGYALGNMFCDSVVKKIDRKIGLDYLAYYLFSFVFLLLRALLMSCLAANFGNSGFGDKCPCAEYAYNNGLNICRWLLLAALRI